MSKVHAEGRGRAPERAAGAFVLRVYRRLWTSGRVWAACPSAPQVGFQYLGIQMGAQGSRAPSLACFPALRSLGQSGSDRVSVTCSLTSPSLGWRNGRDLGLCPPSPRRVLWSGGTRGNPPLSGVLGQGRASVLVAVPRPRCSASFSDLVSRPRSAAQDLLGPHSPAAVRLLAMF